jgi:hypothetical protein
MAGITATTPEEIAHLGQYEEERQSENEKIEGQIEEIKSDEFQFRKNLTIDPEFEVLIPKLADSEYEGLKEDIKKHGCRDPVIVWKDHNVILDGHHRHKICTELGIHFDTIEYEFANRTEAKIWMITNQSGKRNLNTSQLAMQAAKLADLYSEKAKERQGIRTDLGQKIDESERGSSAEKAAKEMGISHTTVSYAIKVMDKGIPEVVELVESGIVTVSNAAGFVAETSPEVQKSVVDVARTQIQEGEKLSLVAILFKMEEEAADPQKKDAAISDSTIEENEKPTDNQDILEGTKIINPPANLPGALMEKWKESNENCDLLDVPTEKREALWENKLTHDKEENVGGSCCNPWGGPWICHHCKVQWEQWAIDHPPKHCPGCDEVDGIRRWSIEDMGPEFMKEFNELKKRLEDANDRVHANELLR